MHGGVRRLYFVSGKPSNIAIRAQRVGGLLFPAPCLVCSGRTGKEMPQHKVTPGHPSSFLLLRRMQENLNFF